MQGGLGTCLVLEVEGSNGRKGFKDCSLLEKDNIALSNNGISFQKETNEVRRPNQDLGHDFQTVPSFNLG